MPEPIMEKFSWMCPELSQVEDSGKHSVTIKGIALFGNTVSRNGRRYVDEELKKSARTWIGKPITVNHDSSKNVGTIKWMEYDQDNRLEYVAVVNKQPYVDMVRMYGRNPKESSLKGVSVEAGYLHTVCSKCNKKFFTEHDYHHHMWDAHFTRTEPTQPFGIIGQALSIVEAPEEPGVSGTTIEVMETVQTGLDRLVETIIKNGEEREKMNEALKGKAVVTQVQTVTPDSAKELAQTPEKTLATPKVEPKFGNLPTVDTATLPVKPEPPKETVKLKEAKLPDKLAPSDVVKEYGSFEACLAAGHTEEQCAIIMKKCSNETAFRKNVSEHSNSLVETLATIQGNIAEVVADYTSRFNSLPKDDTSWSQKIEESEKRVKAHAEDMFNTVPKDDTSWKETIANLPKDDVSWKEMFEKLPEKFPKDDTTWQPLLKELKETFEKFTVELPKIREEINAKLTTTEAKIAAGDKEVLAAFETVKKGFERLLELADKTVAEDKEQIKTLETRLKEQEDKKLKETQDLTQKVDDLTVKTDNLEDKLKPQFKGKNKPATRPEGEEYYDDPLKKKEN